MSTNACDICTLILYPETLLKLLISFRSFWAEVMGSSRYTIMSSLLLLKSILSEMKVTTPVISIFYFLALHLIGESSSNSLFLSLCVSLLMRWIWIQHTVRF